jgi:hypothetical protein
MFLSMLAATSLAASPAPAIANPMMQGWADHPVPAERINAKIKKRAQNAVDNGADPARVRSKVKEYKQKLRRRYNAAH